MRGFSGLPRHLPLMLAALATIGGAGLVAQEIGSRDLLAGLKNPERWLTYSGDYTGQRHSPLTQITPANAGSLVTQWTFQTGVLGRFESSAIVIDGVVYVTGWDNHPWAVDARTGAQLWHYERALPRDLAVCCGRVNKGFAVHGDRLIMATLDSRLVALDRRTGAVVYDVDIEDFRTGYTSTVAPLVVKDKVIVGHAGADYGLRGFLDAFDARTGQRVWRLWTIPGPGEPGSDSWPADPKLRGGAATWTTGTYDPDLNLLYWGTGNPSPDMDGRMRPGDNLYTNSLLAIDADTGKLRWHFQFTPHDTHDWDATQVPVLADLTLDGRPRRVVMIANRNGFFYVLDRTNGEFILGRPFVRTTWAEEIGRDGRPRVLPGTDPTEEGSAVCPGPLGGTNFMSPSFDPAAGLFYVNAQETCTTFYAWKQDKEPGALFLGGGFSGAASGAKSGAIRAIDPLTGLIKWSFPLVSPSWGGVLSTAGGVVFGGDQDGNAIAVDSRTGKHLWHYKVGAPVYGPPTTFMLQGRQYVLVPAGTTLTAFALGATGAERAAVEKAAAPARRR